MKKVVKHLIYDRLNLPKRGWYKSKFSIERRVDILPKFADIIGLGPNNFCSRSDWYRLSAFLYNNDCCIASVIFPFNASLRP